MWSEICELIPLTTGLDSCIEHDIAELESCAKANEEKGYADFADGLRQQAEELRQRKTVLNNMGKFKRWWHCEKQFRKSQKEAQKAINRCKRRLGIW